jgi:hypothetical protein
MISFQNEAARLLQIESGFFFCKKTHVLGSMTSKTGANRAAHALKKSTYDLQEMDAEWEAQEIKELNEGKEKQ